MPSTGYDATAALFPESWDDDLISPELINQTQVGLHHLCFRARSREDVDAIYQTALSLNAKIVRAPKVRPDPAPPPDSDERDQRPRKKPRGSETWDF